jgi:hypothetical protein
MQSFLAFWNEEKAKGFDSLGTTTGESVRAKWPAKADRMAFYMCTTGF